MKSAIDDKLGVTVQTEEYYHHVRREISPLCLPVLPAYLKWVQVGP